MPKNMGRGAGCHVSHRIPDASAKIGTERVEGAPQQAEGPAKEGTVSCMAKKLVTGHRDVWEFTALGRTQRRAGLYGGTPVLHPQGVRRQSHSQPAVGKGWEL